MLDTMPPYVALVVADCLLPSPQPMNPTVWTNMITYVTFPCLWNLFIFNFFAKAYVFAETASFSLTCYSYTRKNICHPHFLECYKGNKPNQIETGLFFLSNLLCLQFLYYLQTWKLHFMCLWLSHIALLTCVVLKLTLKAFPIRLPLIMRNFHL